jgi:hypothetical protein
LQKKAKNRSRMVKILQNCRILPNPRKMAVMHKMAESIQ